MVMVMESRFRVYQDARGLWHWEYWDGGSIPARSVGWYRTRMECLESLEKVKRVVGDAEIVEVSAE